MPPELALERVHFYTGPSTKARLSSASHHATATEDGSGGLVKQISKQGTVLTEKSQNQLSFKYGGMWVFVKSCLRSIFLGNP